MRDEFFKIKAFDYKDENPFRKNIFDALVRFDDVSFVVSGDNPGECEIHFKNRGLLFVEEDIDSILSTLNKVKE